ncbi:YfjI family protein [Geobacillus stearothermophilus]|uniref:YfjI family protein n=1 Tax=Geobacillus stearothermophilus TaxID=1422 RepID=UPI003D204B70
MNNETNYLPIHRTKEEIEEMRKNRKMTDVGAGEELFKEIVDALNKKQSVDNDELEWETPVPFSTYDLPKFDSQVFSPTIKDMVESVAKFTQTPVDLPAIIAFGVLSTVLSKKFFVEPKKGWKEPLNTYTTVLMESSNRKSAAYNAMTEPIYLYEKDLISEMKPKIKKRLAERGAIKKRIEKLQNDYAKTSDPAIREEIKEVVEELEALPELYEPTLLLDNSTEEKIATRLQENNEKIAIMSSEGDLFERMKIKGSDQEKLDIYLKGYSGDHLRVDRVTRNTERLEEPLITICISAQPTVIQNMPRKLNDRGLIPRFLFSIPNDFVGYRDVLNAFPIPERTRNKYISLIKKMLNFSTNQPIALHLEHEAEKLLSTFQMEVEVNFREGGILHDQLKAWGGKLVGQLIRIAGLLHVTKYAETANCIEDIPTVIDKETLTKAIQLKDYFIAHAEKAFGIMKQNELLVDAQFILGKLLAEQKLVISKQALWQKTKKRFEVAEQLNNTLNMLESRFYIQRVFGGKSGRKEMIYVNPLLFESMNADPNTPNTWLTLKNKEKKEGELQNLKVPNSPKINNENNNTLKPQKNEVVKKL